MGDRRVAEVRGINGSLFVYTHWSGAIMTDLAKEATEEAKVRQTDEPYAIRIILDQMMKEGRDKETGWGIVFDPMDAEDSYGGPPSIIIDIEKGEGWSTDQGSWKWGKNYQLPMEESPHSDAENEVATK